MKTQIVIVGFIAAISVTISAMADEETARQSDAKGFFEEDDLNVLNRNYYLYKDNRHAGVETNYYEEWAHGLRIEYTSGYTQGTIGFGVDAHVYSGIKLDTGGGRNRGDSAYPFYLIPVDGNGNAEDSWSKAGAVLKLRVSATELKYGDLRPQVPVYSTGDAFLLPETSTGFYLNSQEIDGLIIEAGHITADSEFISTSHDDELLLNYGDPSLGLGKSLDFVGGFYTFNDEISAGFFASYFDESWNQYYGNLNVTLPIAEQRDFNLDFNIYRTVDTGDSLQGDISNTTYSLAATYKVSAHGFTFSYQAVNGDTPFDYISYDSIWLANSMQYADFNGPEEKSYRLAYELDMETLGFPGLIFKAGYVTSEDVDGTGADPSGGYTYFGEDGQHWERNFEIKYTVQSGPAKDLLIRLRQATHRTDRNYFAGDDDDADEVRFYIEYPWDVI
jgi:imipenem/basic amino acid-specific outer membrane pore